MMKSYHAGSIDEEEESVYERIRLPPRIIIRERSLRNRVISGIAKPVEAVAELKRSGGTRLSD